MKLSSGFLAGCLLLQPSVDATSLRRGLGRRTGNGTAPTVTVLNGTYAGVYNDNYNQDFFLGIPYAQVCFVTLPPSPTAMMM